MAGGILDGFVQQSSHDELESSQSRKSSAASSTPAQGSSESASLRRKALRSCPPCKNDAGGGPAPLATMTPSARPSTEPWLTDAADGPMVTPRAAAVRLPDHPRSLAALPPISHPAGSTPGSGPAPPSTASHPGKLGWEQAIRRSGARARPLGPCASPCKPPANPTHPPAPTPLNECRNLRFAAIRAGGDFLCHWKICPLALRTSGARGKSRAASLAVRRRRRSKWLSAVGGGPARPGPVRSPTAPWATGLAAARAPPRRSRSGGRAGRTRTRAPW